MKIKSIETYQLNLPERSLSSEPIRESWWVNDEVANPMSHYPRYKPHRNLWRPNWKMVWCKVTLEDGTWGLGATHNGRPVAAIIEDHLAPLLIGEDGFAIERIADMIETFSMCLNMDQTMIIADIILTKSVVNKVERISLAQYGGL